MRGKPAVELVPAPPLDLSIYAPDFHDELRWPLAPLDHPRLEPRFAIAQALARPGVSLTKLCSLGAQHRHGIDLDLQSYLRGWCSALAGDVDGACAELAPLIRSATPSIGDAVKADLANILADHGRADDAERSLDRHHIADSVIYDRLAANYVEIGTTDDASAMNRLAIDSDMNPSHADRCMRIAREILLVGSRESLALGDLQALARSRRAFALRGDDTCAKLDAKLRCWARDDCNDFLAPLGTSRDKMRSLQTARASWPSAATAANWRAIAERALYAVPTDGALAIMISAFENELRTSGTCNYDQIEWLSTASGVIDLGIARSRQLRPQLDAVWAHCRQLSSAKKVP